MGKWLKAMILQDVQILTASDAHIPQNVGNLICEMNDLIAKEKKRIWQMNDCAIGI